MKLRVSKIGMWTFCSSLFMGIWAHGFMFANKISFHDDMWCMREFGATIHSERWFLWVLEFLGQIFSINISSSWYNGILALLLLALSASILVEILNVENVINALLMGAVITVFPVVAATYAYMFTSWQYMLGILLAHIAVWIGTTDLMDNKMWYLIGTLVLGMSLGLYQAYISVFASIVVLYLLTLVNKQEYSARIVVRKVVDYVIMGIGGIIVYLCANHVLAWKFNVISTYKEKPILKVLEAIRACYSNYIEYLSVEYLGVNEFWGIRLLTLVIVILSVVLSCIAINKQKDIVNRVFFIVLILIFPMAVNFVCVITLDSVKLHSLMVYGLVYIYILPILLVDNLWIKGWNRTFISKLLIGSLCMVIILFTKLDNVAYLKCNFVKEQAQTYYSTLLTRIQMLEGYKNTYPIAFINIEQAFDSTMTDLTDFRVELTALRNDNMQRF